MMEFHLDPHCDAILQEFRNKRDLYVLLERKATDMLMQALNKQGLYIGIAAAVIFTAWATLTDDFPHHKYMLGVYSHLIVLIVGYVASFLFKTPPADKELTIWGYLEERGKTK